MGAAPEKTAVHKLCGKIHQPGTHGEVSLTLRFPGYSSGLVKFSGVIQCLSQLQILSITCDLSDASNLAAVHNLMAHIQPRMESFKLLDCAMTHRPPSDLSKYVFPPYWSQGLLNLRHVRYWVPSWLLSLWLDNGLFLKPYPQLTEMYIVTTQDLGLSIHHLKQKDDLSARYNRSIYGSVKLKRFPRLQSCKMVQSMLGLGGSLGHTNVNAVFERNTRIELCDATKEVLYRFPPLRLDSWTDFYWTQFLIPQKRHNDFLNEFIQSQPLTYEPEPELLVIPTVGSLQQLLCVVENWTWIWTYRSTRIPTSIQGTSEGRLFASTNSERMNTKDESVWKVAQVNGAMRDFIDRQWVAKKPDPRLLPHIEQLRD